jgi:hypothetical protein
MLFVLRRKARAWKTICLESLSIFLLFYEKPPEPSFPVRNMHKEDVSYGVETGGNCAVPGSA